MSQENTLTERVIEQIREQADTPEAAAEAIAALDEKTEPKTISEVARRTTSQAVELGESKAEEKAVIQAAQDQVERFNNWWGKMTGQHAHAVADLETVQESSGAKIKMIDTQIEELQGHFENVVAGAFGAGEEPEHDTLDA